MKTRDCSLKIFLLVFISVLLSSTEANGQDSLLTKTKVSYQFDIFNEEVPNWNSIELEASLNKGRYLILPKITLTRRFDENGIQVETDVYKTLRNKDYINFGAGYSRVVIFPRLKANFEYYNAFAKTWEYSIGMRGFSFENTGLIGVGTASVSKYYGSFLSILRGNITYGKDASGFTGAGGVLTQRYYLGSAKYIGLFGAYGYDASLIAVTENLRFGESPDQVSAGIMYQTDRKKNGQWDFSYSWTRFNFSNRGRDQHTFRISYSIYWTEEK